MGMQRVAWPKPQLSGATNMVLFFGIKTKVAIIAAVLYFLNFTENFKFWEVKTN